MTDIIATLEARVRELNGKLRATPEFRELQATRQYLDTLRALHNPPAQFSANGPPSAPVAPALRQPQLTWAEQASKILLEIGRPVNSRRLVAEMQKRGLHVGGAKPEINLASILSRAASVNSVRWGGRKRWWPTAHELPPEPDQIDDEDSAGERVSNESPADFLQTDMEAHMEPP